jgi:hypothetical protein
MSMPNASTDNPDEGVEPGSLTEPTDGGEYGSLSIEDDPEGTVDPGDLAGGADETDEDVS